MNPLWVAQWSVLFLLLPFTVSQDSSRPLIISLPIHVRTTDSSMADDYYDIPNSLEDTEQHGMQQTTVTGKHPDLPSKFHSDLPAQYRQMHSDLSAKFQLMPRYRHPSGYDGDSSAFDEDRSSFLPWNPSNRMLVLRLGPPESTLHEIPDSGEMDVPWGPPVSRISGIRPFPGNSQRYPSFRPESEPEDGKWPISVENVDPGVYGTDPVVHLLKQRQMNRFLKNHRHTEKKHPWFEQE